VEASRPLTASRGDRGKVEEGMNRTARELLLISVALMASGCGDKQQTLRLSHYMTPCWGVGPQLCYVEERTGYLRYDGVIGWAFHWGFRYELQVTTTHVSHPLADAPSSVDTLIKETAERVPAGTRFSIPIADNVFLERVDGTTYSLLGRRRIDCAARSLCETLSSALEQTRPCVQLELSHPADEGAPLLLERISRERSVFGCGSSSGSRADTRP
jgi:hypothetical protein